MRDDSQEIASSLAWCARERMCRHMTAGISRCLAKSYEVCMQVALDMGLRKRAGVTRGSANGVQAAAMHSLGQIVDSSPRLNTMAYLERVA